MTHLEASPSYYRARYYNPQTGRFISEDPIGFVGGDLDLYVYTGSTPTSKIDPSGQQTICPFFEPDCIQQQHLSDCAKKVLQPYFPGLNLDTVVVSPGMPGFTQFTPGFNPDAITLNGTIFYDQGTFSADAAGLASVGHELTHVQQQRSSGFLPFMKDYLHDYFKNLANGMGASEAYNNLASERAGKAMENRIFGDLFKGKFDNICKSVVCK
jgi:RHS repeat-associated protein